MAEPMHAVTEPPTVFPPAREQARPAWRFRVRLWWRALVARLAAPARLLPGLAAAGCALAGAWLLWSLGVALLVAAGLLLLVDARTPRA